MRAVNITHPGSENKISSSHLTLVSIAVFIFSFAFYVFTLAPTVLWGDNAAYALAAMKMDLSIAADSHPLFIVLAHFFNYLPFEPAYNLNLLSAATSSLAVLLIYLIVRKMTGSMASAMVGAISLCISHAFWLNAVIGKNYGLNAFFMAVLVLTLLKWREKPTDNRFLYLAGFLFGLGLSNHFIIALIIVGLFFFVAVINYRVFLNLKILAKGIGSFLIGASLLVYLFGLKLMAGRTVPSMVDDATGHGLKKAMLEISPGIFRDILMYFSYLFYQFPAVGLSLIFIGIFALIKKDRIVAIFLLLLIFVNMFFFLSFGPGIERTTKYTFYISDYTVFSILIGYGFFAFTNYVRNKVYSLIKVVPISMALIILLPLFLYNLTPYASKGLGIDLLHARILPYRDNETYFLNPSKRGYIGAARYAEKAFEVASLDSIIIADHTPYHVLKYFQEIKGARNDISVLSTGEGKQNSPQKVLAKYYGKRDIYLADLEKGYYRIGRLKDEYDFAPEGVLYRIVRKSTNYFR